MEDNSLNPIEDFKTFTARMKELKAVKEEEAKSSKQEAYADFFKQKLKEYNVGSPAELSEEDRAKFFDEIKKEWDTEKSEPVNEDK